MIRKFKEHQKALFLRQNGKSIRQIAKLLKISPSTASKWCKHIKLSPKQQEFLLNSESRTSHLRRLAKQSHRNKLLRVKELTSEAKAEIKHLNKNELFLTGLALYWAEGFKSLKEGRVGFCNSDPKMIKFFIKWLKRSFDIKPEDLILRAEFNESHEYRKEEIEKFWSKTTRIPKEQFERSFYHKSIWLKRYENPENYYGVLRIRVRKSSELLTRIRGWIDGLRYAA